MSGHRHYTAFVKKPVAGTVFDFHVAATEICDEEPLPPLGASPMPITEGMAHWQRSYWARWNPLLSLLEEQMRTEAVAALAAAGLPASRLVEPFAPAVELLINQYVRGSQHGLLLEHEYRKSNPPRRKNPYVQPPHRRVIVAAWMCCGGPTGACHALNGGLPTGVGGGLTRDHVDRVMYAYKRVPGRTKSVLQVELLLYRTNFLGMERVRLSAGLHPEFKGLRGRELAAAIHESRDLWNVMSRVVSEIPRSQVPLVA
ncbi:hypothetical protein [Methylobacterium iners]|uniref:Uncharacterized protein n=1 Tax=Methylobacterium iners TaxID=418707 RepID=A0ABQ4S2B6_9HYPH|nr:hypothetical protein [Methylobacterium iners]GJD96547.1 hypothetical protein OCOJLMKI_3769 [Methylobacterium iners]